MAEAVYDKSNAALPATYASGINDGFLYGELDPLVRIMENGLSFEVNVAEGQKTGFFWISGTTGLYCNNTARADR